MNKNIILVSLAGIIAVVTLGIFMMSFTRTEEGNNTTTNQTQRVNAAETTKRIPNTLFENEGALVKVNFKGEDYLFATSVYNMLRPGSTGSEELILQGEEWQPILYSSLHANDVLFPGGPLLRFDQRTQEISETVSRDEYFLRVYNIENGNLENTISYHTGDTILTSGVEIEGDVKYTNVSSDYLVDFAVDASNKKIYMLVAIDGSSGALWGDSTSESSVEIIEVDVVNGTAESIVSFTSEKATLVHEDEADTWLLPTEIHYVEGAVLLTWRNKLERVDLLTGNRQDILSLTQEDWDANRQLSVESNPTGTAAIIFDSVGYMTNEEESSIRLFNAADRTLSVIGPLSADIVQQHPIWNDSGTQMVTTSNTSSTIYQISLENNTLTSLDNMVVERVYDWLPSGELLVSIFDVYEDPDEIPETDSNYRSQFYLYNLETGLGASLGNYRSPHYFGRV
ncbi:MAG: hypothetical protein WCV86_04950 [Patescibacteria group bacterium]|jgi:hypothetical protein